MGASDGAAARNIDAGDAASIGCTPKTMPQEAHLPNSPIQHFHHHSAQTAAPDWTDYIPVNNEWPEWQRRE
jgi:hypothetical protein